MSGPNLRTDHTVRLGPSNSGFSGTVPRLMEMAKAEMLQPHNHLFAFSSMFNCISSTGAGGGLSNSVWNGATSLDAGWGAGETLCVPEPTIPVDGGGLFYCPIVMPILGHTTGDYYEVVTTVVALTISVVTITWRDNLLAGKGAIVYNFLAIGPRKGSSVPAIAEIAKAAVAGGEPTVPGNVFLG